MSILTKFCLCRPINSATIPKKLVLILVCKIHNREVAELKQVVFVLFILRCITGPNLKSPGLRVIEIPGGIMPPPSIRKTLRTCKNKKKCLTG